MKTINVLDVGTNQIEINKKGYLVNFYDWNDDVAITLAKTNKIELTEFHWITISYLRDYYASHQVPPPPRVLIKAIGGRLKLVGNSRSSLKRVFPIGGYKLACRLAGLPTHQSFAC